MVSTKHLNTQSNNFIEVNNKKNRQYLKMTLWQCLNCGSRYKYRNEITLNFIMCVWKIVKLYTFILILLFVMIFQKKNSKNEKKYLRGLRKPKRLKQPNKPRRGMAWRNPFLSPENNLAHFRRTFLLFLMPF